MFGLVSWLPLALLLLATAGAADVVSAVFRNAILQLTVPDGLRGRLAAIHIGVVTGGPRPVSGGLARLAGVALLAWRLPELDRTVMERSGPPDDPGGPLRRRAQQLDL